MSRIRLAGLATLLVIAAPAAAAHADATLVPGLTFTARSGAAGTSTTDIGATSDSDALSMLSAGEAWDVPCELRTIKSDINGAGTSITDDFDRCTTTSPNKTVGWLNNEGIHVYGIQVCTHSANDRLKGIKLIGGEVQSDGTFDRAGHSKSFERTNCNTWGTTVFCPVGQVATKVRVHHTGDTINGLSLGCRVVAPL